MFVPYCFSPEDCTVLRNTLIVLVREYDRQKKGVLLYVCSYIVLMNWGAKTVPVTKCKTNLQRNPNCTHRGIPLLIE